MAIFGAIISVLILLLAVVFTFGGSDDMNDGHGDM